MKTVKLLAVFGGAIATACMALGLATQAVAPKANAPLKQQRFQVRGEVKSIDAASQSLRIKHEEIPGYMAAMTMPFEVRDAALLRGLKAGDDIGFELVVTKEDSWIGGIQRLSESSTAQPREITQLTAAEVQRVQAGEAVPDFALLNQDGRPVRLSDFRGKAVVLTFVYTRCPLPNYCPLLSKNFASLQERLNKRFPGKFQLLSLSIDPEFDRPEVLKSYASRYTHDQSNWTFATGTTEQTDAVGALFGLIQERAGGLVNHDLRTALISPEGKLVHLWKSNAWTPYEIERRMIDSGF